jgi:hypothetical protein
MSARIKIDQVGLPAGVAGVSRTDGLDTGALVTLTNTDPQGVTTFRLLWGPTDDVTAEASLAATVDPDVWTFAPDAGCYGSYRIEMLEDGVPVERRIFGIRTPANGLLFPAFNELASRHASWANDGADQIELSENNAVDFNDADLNSLAYAGWWRSLVELYRAFENGLNFPPTLVVAGTQAIRASGDLLLNGVTGTALESCASPTVAVASGDVCINADSGIAITTGSQRASVGGNIDMLTAGDLIANALSGMNLCADAAAAVASVGTGVIALNAPTNGVAITCGLAEENLVGGGDFKVNTSSGIRLHSGAVKQTTATGLQLSTDFDLEFDVEDDALWNILGGFAIACGGLTNPGPIDGRAIWHLTNGFVLSSDGSAGGSGGILIEAAAAVSSAPPVDGVVQINTSVAMRLTGAPFFQIAEAAASTPSNAAGQGMFWVESVAPCEARFTDDVDADWPLNVHGVAGMGAITTRTNSTTDLDGANFTAPASTWRAATTIYKFSGMLYMTRGATATAANIVIDVQVAGVAQASTGNIATPTGNGNFLSAWVEGYVTCITIGSSGTAIATIRALVNNNGTVQEYRSTTITTFTLNTTLSRALVLTARFSNAVADLSMTWQGANIRKER